MTLNLASWNIRGLNMTYKQDDIRSFVFKNKISLLGLMETKVRALKGLKISKAILRHWRFSNNNDHHSNGRIWVAWDPSILNVKVEYASSQLMHTSVTIIDTNQRFFASFVYGFNTATKRSPLCRDIRQISTGIATAPWILLGDFNVVRHPSERLGGDPSWHPYFDDFNACCYQSSLDDLRYSGHYLTWSNKSSDDKLISSKLDRALINIHWESIFNGSNAIFLPPGVSNHCPTLVSTGVAIRTRKPSFKFFNF